MKVLVNPKITINEAVKNKCFGFQILLLKEDLNQLTVKARSYDGRSRGVVGKITRGGSFILSNNYKNQVPVITPSIQIKIDLTLDLIYGRKRDGKVQFGSKGLVNFNNNSADEKRLY